MSGRHYFLSFHHDDRDWADWIAAELRAAGHRVTCQADWRAGSDFVREIRAASATCDATVAVLSAAWLGSDWGQAEANAAIARDPLGKDRRLIPVRVRECRPEDLLRSRIYVDLVGRDRESARRLLESAFAEAPASAERAPFPGDVTTAFPGRPDAFEAYRNWAFDKHGRVEMIGLGANDLPCYLDQIYVPLLMDARGWGPDDDDAVRHRKHGLGGDGAAGTVPLERAFAAAERRELALIGVAGAGKTTVLKKLLHQTLTEGGASLGLDPDTLPVFLRLRRLQDAHLEGTLGAFIQRELDEEAPGMFPAPFGEDMWRRGRLLLLLDGLDEVANDDLRARICRFLDQRLTGQRPHGIRAALATRRSGLGRSVTLPAARFLSLDVRPLDDERIAQLVHVWLRAALRARDPLPERRDAADARARKDADDLLARLREATDSSRQILELVSTPLLLTLLCIVFVRGRQIPRRRVEFYEECLRVLLERWGSAQDLKPPLELEDSLTILRDVAWHLHDAGRRDDLGTAEFEEIANPHLTRMARRTGRVVPAAELLLWLHRRASILDDYAPGQWGFSHLAFQEYLAAMHVAIEGGGLVTDLARKLGTDWWRKTTLLLLGLPRYRVFTPFMREVAAGGPVAEHHDFLRNCLDEAQEASAAPFVEALGAPATDDARRAALLRLFVGRRDPDMAAAALPLVTHRDPDVAALARRLAEESGLEVAPLPGAAAAAPVWVEATTGIRFLPVPGGRFVMGADDIDDDSRPPHPVRVSPFLLAETPVSNRQYGVFLEATKGKEPELWRDRRFSAPEQPVVGVSWNDAVAYCKWLAKGCGRQIALPSEAQWEFAARGEDGRKYPWGNEAPDARRAVFGLDGSTGQPAPVGSCPDGRGPFGHLDLAGNVWEWCDDVWDAGAYAKRAARRTAAVDPVVRETEERWRSARAVRGGGWLNDARGLRSAFRDGGDAGSLHGLVGFRVAVSAASTVHIAD